MKIRLSKIYMSRLKARINGVSASAKSFDWDQLSGPESAQYWHDCFRAGCWEIDEYRKHSSDSKSLDDAMSLFRSTMANGRLRWPEILELEL